MYKAFAERKDNQREIMDQKRQVCLPAQLLSTVINSVVSRTMP